MIDDYEDSKIQSEYRGETWESFNVEFETQLMIYLFDIAYDIATLKPTDTDKTLYAYMTQQAYALEQFNDETAIDRAKELKIHTNTFNMLFPNILEDFDISTVEKVPDNVKNDLIKMVDAQIAMRDVKPYKSTYESFFSRESPRGGDFKYYIFDADSGDFKYSDADSDDFKYSKVEREDFQAWQTNYDRSWKRLVDEIERNAR